MPRSSAEDRATGPLWAPLGTGVRRRGFLLKVLSKSHGLQSRDIVERGRVLIAHQNLTQVAVGARRRGKSRRRDASAAVDETRFRMSRRRRARASRWCQRVPREPPWVWASAGRESPPRRGAPSAENPRWAGSGTSARRLFRENSPVLMTSGARRVAGSIGATRRTRSPCCGDLGCRRTPGARVYGER